MTIENICNQALDAVGYKRHIGSIWDGTRAARVALDAWAETRDALLIATAPDWARKDAPLTPSATAPDDYTATPWTVNNPDLPWKYEYVVPTDCLVPLSLKSRPATLPIWRPRPQRFRIKTEGSSYTLLGNDPSPILIYIWSVIDTSLWHEDFTELMIAALARKFAPALVGAPQQEEKQDADSA